MDDLARIGSVARRCGLTFRALHYYEECGYLGEVTRLADGTRLYSAAQAALLDAVVPMIGCGIRAQEAFVIAGRGGNLSTERLVELMDRAARTMHVNACVLSRLHGIHAERLRRSDDNGSAEAARGRTEGRGASARRPGPVAGQDAV